MANKKESTDENIKQQAFQQLYKNFCTRLQQIWQLSSVRNHFHPTETMEGMFKYLWSLNEAQNSLTVCGSGVETAGKGTTESETFRNEGNKLYKDRNFEKALFCYNFAITTAPHPLGVISKGDMTSYAEKNSNADSQCLHLGYGNRSALLFETQQYNSCIRDIDMAVLHGYPKKKVNRLMERKAKSLKALGRHDQAKATLESTIEMISTVGMEEKELKSAVSILEKLIDEWAIGENTETSDAANVGSFMIDGTINLKPASKYEYLFSNGTSKVPMIESPNINLPCFSDAVATAFAQNKGRHLVATRDIRPGEILLVEKAFSSVVRLDSTVVLRSRCSSCLVRTHAPVPCPTCALVVFCSPECRDEALRGFHSLECQLLPVLRALDLDVASILALRVVIQVSWPSLKVLVKALKDEEAEKSKLQGPTSQVVLNVSKDYRTIYHMVGNLEMRAEEDLLEMACVALVLTKLLLKSKGFFVDAQGNPVTPTPNDVTLLGTTLFRHRLSMQCNSHCIKEPVFKGSRVRDYENKTVGYGVYCNLSLTNHSCNPTALHASVGSTKFLYAVGLIRKGSEVTDSYGERYVSHKLQERLTSLYAHYFFKCSCEACIHNWPLFKNLPTTFDFRCTKCSGPIDLTKLSCPKCQILYNMVKRKGESPKDMSSSSYDLEKTKKALGVAWERYSQVFGKTEKTGTMSRENFDSVVALLQVMGEYLVQPNKAYIEVQETLMHCYNLLGSWVPVKTS